MKNLSNEEIPKHIPRNRKTSHSKLRRGGKHCPVCLEPLEKNARRTRLAKKCYTCEAQHIHGKVCIRCGKESIWMSRKGAACQACGFHGKRDEVARIKS